jgi:6-phosphogluconolactonase (cycloisomerase 2 family)
MIEDAFQAGASRQPVLLCFAFKFSQESRMLQKALVLIFSVASIASCVSCGKTSSHYVYATIPAANQVKAYREDPNSGVLTEIQGSPYPVGDGATSAALHPSGKFLYVANPGQQENDISLFTIATNGALTEVTPRTSVETAGTPGQSGGSQPEFLAMDPGGNYLYAANTQSDNISVFSIDNTTGALTQLANSPFPIGLPPLNMRLAPSGNFLYVTASGSPDGYIVGYSVNAGVLTSIGSPFSSDGVNPNGLAIDPKGAFLYVANSSSPSIAIFSIGQSGILSPVQNSPLADTYTAPVALTLDAKGTFLYVANQGSSNVAVYSISSTSGLPTVLTNSTTTGAFFTEGSPSFVAVDPTGQYLFVGNQGTSAGIQSFSVSSGNLTALFKYNVGNTPSSIVVLQ